MLNGLWRGKAFREIFRELQILHFIFVGPFQVKMLSSTQTQITQFEFHQELLSV